MKATRLKILLMLAVLLLSLGNRAEETTLVVKKKNGDITYYKLQERPILSFWGSELKIENKTTTIYERSEILKFYFEKLPGAGIEDVRENEDALIIAQTDNGKWVISNLADNENIIVSDIAGRLYNGLVSKNGSDAVIDLISCPKGIYIIKVGNNQSIKITRK